MRIEFLRPWALLLLPVCAALVFWIDARYARRGIRRAVTAGARLFVILLTVLALAGPSLPMASGAANAWLLMDVSDSMREGRQAAESAMREALAHAPQEQRTGVIAFGENAMVELPLSAGGALSSLQSEVDGGDTDANGALQLALALLPGDGAGRVALISDGQFALTDGQLALLRARGVPIDVYKVESSLQRDAQVTRVDVPARVYQGQSFRVTVEMESNADGRGTLVLYAGREAVATREVTLRRGTNTYAFEDIAETSGTVTYEAQLILEGDSRTQNDRMGAYMTVLGAPNVLLVEGKSGEAAQLGEMLAAAGMRCEVVAPAYLAASAEALMAYDAIALVNVNASAIGEGQLAALTSYVRTLGRGLCVFGGDDSFAPGGYRGSALEEILPVTADVRNQADLPSLALLLVIDKSGSMADDAGATRLEMAKEAACRAVEVLTERDQVGVIAFDDASKWVVELQSVTDVAAIQSAIGTIRAGGGTSFYSPLRDAYSALSRAEAQLKHIIFLTDGASSDSGYEQIIAMMAEKGITFTSVAIGDAANQQLLRQLSSIGGGRFYAAGEYDNVPEIFAKETYLVSGAYVQNRTFTPAVAEESALTDFAGFPPLSGYLAAREKPLSTVALVSDRDDPILAWWQYGAGRVLCWTSDVRGGWTQAYLSWEEGADFFAGQLSFVMSARQAEGALSARIEGDTLRISYALPEGASAEGLRTRATVLSPQGEEIAAALSESAPGVFSGEISSGGQGAYAIRVEQTDASGTLVRAVEGGAVSAYSPEYDITRPVQARVLERLAEETGGRVVTDAAQLLDAPTSGALERRDISDALLFAALLGFLADIALRKLPWERALARAMARRGAGAAARPAKPAREKAPSARRRPKAPAQASPPQEDTAAQLLKARDNKRKL